MIESISPTASKKLRTVNVRINSEYSELLMEFLVHSNIPFSVQFGNLPTLIEDIIPSIIPQKLTNENPIVENANWAYNNPSSITPLITKESSSVSLKKSKKEVSLPQQIYNRYIKNVNPEGIPKLSEIAAEFRVSEGKVKSSIKKAYGKTFYQLHMEFKMKYAAKLILQGYKANVVSKMIGYSNNSAIKFNKMFQKYFGMTPKKYQTSNVNYMMH